MTLASVAVTYYVLSCVLSFLMMFGEAICFTESLRKKYRVKDDSSFVLSRFEITLFAAISVAGPLSLVSAVIATSLFEP